MYLRADSVLHSLLREVFERVEGGQLAGHVEDALEIMGTRSPYKGGKGLIQQLAFIEREAEEAGDELVSTAMRDAAAYMTGEILTADLESKYSMYDDSGQDRGLGLSKTMSAGFGLAAVAIKQFVRECPDSTLQDVIALLDRRALEAIRFVRLRRSGHYGAFRIGTDNLAWVTDVLVDRTTLMEGASESSVEGSVGALLRLDSGEDIIAAAQRRLRLAALDRLENAVLAPFTSELRLQEILSKESWLFGGEFVGLSAVRRLMPGVEVDLTLVRPDGVMHVVELKLASVKTVKRHRGKVVPTSEVHDAVAQLANYLQVFDEGREAILAEHGLDARRAAGTVVVGHPSFDIDFTDDQVHEALRTYTSHLGRIAVMTYQQLIDSARRFFDTSSDHALPLSSARFRGAKPR